MKTEQEIRDRISRLTADGHLRGSELGPLVLELNALEWVLSSPPQDMCKCGHEKRDHIYHEGACRTGKVFCSCEKFTPQEKPAEKSCDTWQAALREARSLAVSLWEQHFKHTNPDWEPQETVVGLILQISNMVMAWEPQQWEQEKPAEKPQPETNADTYGADLTSLCKRIKALESQLQAKELLRESCNYCGSRLTSMLKTEILIRESFSRANGFDVEMQQYDRNGRHLIVSADFWQGKDRNENFSRALEFARKEYVEILKLEG